ncbi:MAG: JmjC domain-containing protein [Flammeovirgaceae bacterium]
MDFKLLERILFPHLIHTFFDEFFGQKLFHVSRNDASYYNEYLTKQQIDEWFETGDIYFPTVTLIRGSEVDPTIWTKEFATKSSKRGRPIDRVQVQKLFEEGSTLVVRHFSDHVHSLYQFMKQLRATFKTNAADHLIISPATSQGYPIHGDYQHVCVLQLAGEKKWHFYDTIAKSLIKEPVRYQLNRKPSKTLVMQPGDFLYIPPNLRHSTEVEGSEVSMSLSITITPLKGIDLLRKALNESFAGQPRLREEVPIYTQSTPEDRQAYYQQIKKRFIDYLDQLDFEDVLAELMAEKDLGDAQRSIFERDDAIDQTPITLESELIRSNAKKFTLNSIDNLILFKYLTHTLHYFKTVEFSLNYITSHTCFKVKDIPALIPDHKKIEMVQELVDIGFLTRKTSK